jgi:hypothetical protein
MQELREIVMALSSRRLDRIDTFNEMKKNRDRLFYKFYDGIYSGKLKTNEDAAKELYNDSEDSSRYKMVKKRFTERVYTTLLFLLPRENSPKTYTKALYYCYKHFVVARLLTFISASMSARKLLEKVVRMASKYEIFEIVELSAIQLRREYMLRGDTKMFEYYDKLFLDNQQVLYAEALAEKHYYEITIQLANTYAQQPKLAEKTRAALAEIADLRIVYNTFNLNNYYYTTKLIYEELINDYQSALHTSEEFESYLLQNPTFYSKTRHANALISKVNCYLHLGQNKKGIKAAEKTSGFYQKGSNNWFTVQELYFLLTIHTGNIEKAGEIYFGAISEPRYEVLRERQSEVWKVYGGYLWFIYRYHRRHDLIKEYYKSETFNIFKLINDLSVYSKDKKGFNIAVLILQTLILLERRDFETIITHIEALRAYAYNNLKRSEALRSYYFIQLLVLLVKSDFDPSKMKSKTKSIFQRMQQEKVNYNSTQTRMEVLPYEELWKMILNMLEARDKKGKEKAAPFTEAA